MKFLSFTFLLSVFYTSTFSQSFHPDCNKYQFEDFVLNNEADSIYVYRNYALWVEMHPTHRNQFNIIWTDACNFALQYKSTSKEDKSAADYRKGDTLFYSYLSSIPDGIVYTVHYKNQQYNDTLKRKTGLDAFALAATRDKEMIKDAERLRKMYGPENGNLSTAQLNRMFIESMFNEPEVRQLEKVILMLQNNNLDSLQYITSESFNTVATPVALKDFSQYIRDVYGPLLSYTLVVNPIQTDIGGLFNLPKSSPSASLTESSKYELEGVFKNTNGAVDLSIRLINEDGYKVQDIRLQPEKHTILPVVDSITANFWKKVDKKAYKELYNESSEVMKQLVTYDQFKTIAEMIRAAGSISDFKLLQPNFGVERERGAVSAVYQLEGDQTKTLVTLIYLIENGKYELGGLNFKVK